MPESLVAPARALALGQPAPPDLLGPVLANVGIAVAAVLLVRVSFRRRELQGRENGPYAQPLSQAGRHGAARRPRYPLQQCQSSLDGVKAVAVAGSSGTRRLPLLVDVPGGARRPAFPGVRGRRDRFGPGLRLPFTRRRSSLTLLKPLRHCCRGYRWSDRPAETCPVSRDSPAARSPRRARSSRDPEVLSARHPTARTGRAEACRSRRALITPERPAMTGPARWRRFAGHTERAPSRSPAPVRRDERRILAPKGYAGTQGAPILPARRWSEGQIAALASASRIRAHARSVRLRAYCSVIG